MFEYKIFTLDSSIDKAKATSELNKLGKDGWELVSTEAFSKAGFTQAMFEAGITSGFMFIFKRNIK
jgi:hypothetical protein